jgi:hypothetical protein
LAEAQIIAGPREASRFRDGVENPDFVPIHGTSLMPRMHLTRGILFLMRQQPDATGIRSEH